MTSEFADAMVAVPGGQVFTRRWGPDRSDRAPIVVLHDSPGSVELWREFPVALSRATDRRVVACDRLGFGTSTPRSGPAAHDFVHQEAATGFPAVGDALGILRCVLFGHSVGGAMAIAIPALHPDRCEAVITESAQAFVEPRTLAGDRLAGPSAGRCAGHLRASAPTSSDA
jgi:pimeloyl-ACP methyl ester carboxylesterase